MEMISFLNGYRSRVANDIESEFSDSGRRCHGIMSWDLSWLRGDDGNTSADYYETMCIAERLMIPTSETPELKWPTTLTPGMRALKTTLADAYIEAAPSSRRNITLVTIAVDSIWKEVTTISGGKRVLLRDRYMKEVAWLRAWKKNVTNLNEKYFPEQSTIRANSIVTV